MKKILSFVCVLAMTSFFMGRAGAQVSPKEGRVDLAVGSVLLSEAGCELTVSDVKVLVYNYGTEEVNGFNIEYITSAGDTVKEVSDQVIDAAVNATTPGMVYYDFKTKADLVPDKVLTVNVKVSLLEGTEMSLTNNQGSASTIGYSTASVPSEFQASASELFSNSGKWYYDESENAMVQETKGTLSKAQPLYTRCIDLTPGVYRVSFIYATGEMRRSLDGELMGVWLDPFEVLVGETGTAIGGWQQIYVDDSSCTSKFYQEAACSFEVTEEKTFQFAVNMLEEGEASQVGEYYYQWGWAIKVRSFKIEKLEDHKVVASTIISELPHSIAMDLLGEKYGFTADVKNEGKNTEKVYVSYAFGSDLSKEIGRSDTVVLDPETSLSTQASIQLPVSDLGTKDTVVAMVNLVDAENSAEGNQISWKYSYEVTDSTCAYDFVTPERFESGDYTFGGNVANSIEFGVPYTINKADTLTSITLGLAQSLEMVSLKVSLYQWDAENAKLGASIYSTEFMRGQKPQFMQIVLDRPRLLSPGNYMLAVEQKSSKVNAAIMFDGEEDGEVWLLSSSSGPKKQTGLGYMVARMNFGHTTTKLLEKDVMVVSIDKPTGDGRFSETEDVVATVMNAGMAEAVFSVYCKVGDQIESEKDTLGAYESKSVSFKMNLFEAGEHTIEVYTVMEGDENSENDTVTRVVNSLGAPDPYVMDFEYVDDFEYKNLTPWTALDVDTMYTVGLDGFDIPNEGQKMAFMAFNPMLVANWNDNFPGYQGQRYGYCPSSAVDTVPNNDWLISSRLRLPESGSSISFAVKSANPDVKEKFNVMVSTTNSLVTSFKKVGETLEATATGYGPDQWTEMSVDLSEYNGKAVYVAIQCVSNSVSENFTAFMIDDIRVTKLASNEDVADLDGYFHLYPNPVSDRVYITSSGLDMKRIEVFNLTGMRVYTSGDRSGDSAIIPVNGWASGMYMARIITNSGVQTIKFVVR